MIACYDVMMSQTIAGLPPRIVVVYVRNATAEGGEERAPAANGERENGQARGAGSCALVAQCG